jgi:virginiamycin A acetyltransferase
MSLLNKIPVVHAVMQELERRRFKSAWRKNNSHNETKAGDRFFPLQIVNVGKGTYGTINIQSMYAIEKNQITIGNYVSIAPEVTFLLDLNHQIDTATTFPFHSKLIKRSPIDAISKGPIVVDDEVWIGTGAYIFSGVTIGKGAIIAAGALVTKDVPAYAIVGGNPAKPIRYRFNEEIIKILLPIRFADFSEEWIKKNIDIIYKKIETVDDALKLKALADSYHPQIHEQ